MKKFAYIIFTLLIASPLVNAQPKDPNQQLLEKWQGVIKDPNDANEVLKVKWAAVTKVLQDKQLDQKAKGDIIDKIICPVFNFPAMSKLSLGKTNWAKLTPDQAKQFSKLFIKMLKDTYRTKIALYHGQQATIKPAVQKGKFVNVPMEMLNDDKVITILYKFHKEGKKLLVYDVEIEGVSIILTYRSQFNDILSHGSFDDIIAHLQKPVTEKPVTP